jgi:hypothetical protein
VLGHELAEHFILLSNLGLQLLQTLGLGILSRFGAVLEDDGALLEEALLPLVEERGLDAMLLADLGDRGLLDEMLAENGKFLDPEK